MADVKKESERERTARTPLSEGVIAAASEGFIIAAISAVAYIYAFVYEAGFAKVFSIPLSFITLSLTNVLIVAGSLLLVGQLVFYVANLVFTVFGKFDGPISTRVKLLTPLLLYSLALVFLTFGTHLLSSFIVVLIGGFLLGIFLHFVFPLLTQRSKGDYREKLVAQDRRDAQATDLWSLLARRLGVGPYNLILSLVMALFVVYIAGQSAAMKQSEYLVTSTSPEMVVLRVYGNNMVCTPLDRSTREVEPNFVVLKVGEDPNLMLYSEQIGPLSLEERVADVDDSSLESPVPTPQP